MVLPARSWRAWSVAVLAGLALLAGLGVFIWQRSGPADHPALWRASRSERHFWLLGTIHAVPRHANWQSPAVRAAMADSDRLVLEAAGLAQERADRSVFERLGRAPGLPPFSARIGPTERQRLVQIGTPPATLDPYEDWAAALLIAAAGNERAGTSAQDAPEPVLEARFRVAGKPVLGLETVAGQLGRFDALPRDDQLALLIQAIDEASDAPQLDKALYASWARGDLAALERQVLAPLAALPRVRSSLIDARNAAWAQRIDALMARDASTMFVAVGAGHLIGPGNLRDRLAAHGWSVERIE